MASIAFANPTRHRLSGLCSRIAGGADHSNLLVTDVQRARRLQSPVRSRDRRVSNSGAWCRHLVQTHGAADGEGGGDARDVSTNPKASNRRPAPPTKPAQMT